MFNEGSDNVKREKGVFGKQDESEEEGEGKVWSTARSQTNRKEERTKYVP